MGHLYTDTLDNKYCDSNEIKTIKFFINIILQYIKTTQDIEYDVSDKSVIN